MTSLEVRKRLVDALRLELIGPEPGLGATDEVLDQAPSRWYLTGFLVPRDAGVEQKAEEHSDEEVAEEPTTPSAEEGVPEPAAAKKKYLPSSMGLSVLVPKEADTLKVVVRWGDYAKLDPTEASLGKSHWQRRHREEYVSVNVPKDRMPARDMPLPNSHGLVVAWSVRPVNVSGNLAQLIPTGTRVVSIFVVNRRMPADTDRKDESFAFQVQLIATAPHPFVPRPNLRSFESDDWDDRVADLQYRDAFEYAVGHGVSAEGRFQEARCAEVRTCWIPDAEVERIAPSSMKSVMLSMDDLAQLLDGADAKAKLGNLVTEYRQWIAQQQAQAPSSPARRKETANFLLADRAAYAATRIEQGIAVLQDPLCLEAFRIANRVMAQQARQRRGVWEKKDPATIPVPGWYPFQLAYILMNLSGIADPKHADRATVDLLFFPTGGGKTEAYLGLAAFTLALRRLRNPGIGSAGLTVLMRYTLRLLTLDQLSRGYYDMRDGTGAQE